MNAFDARVDYIGNCPIYWVHPTFIQFDLPFLPYTVSGLGWSGETNVNTAFLHYYSERLAVALTAWGDLRERFGCRFEALCARYGREAVRDQFIATLQYRRIW